MSDPVTDIAIFLPSLEGRGRAGDGDSGQWFRRARISCRRRSGDGQRTLSQASSPRCPDRRSGKRDRDPKCGGLGTIYPPQPPRALLAALSHANVVAILAHRMVRSDARLVVSERLSLSAARRYHRSPKDRIIRAMARGVYRWADRVVVVANAMVDELEQQLGLPRNRIESIYNPVIDRALLEAAEQPCEHPWLKTAHEIPVVLGCGRLSAQRISRPSSKPSAFCGRGAQPGWSSWAKGKTAPHWKRRCVPQAWKMMWTCPDSRPIPFASWRRLRFRPVVDL